MDLGLVTSWLRSTPLADAATCHEQLALVRALRGVLDAREMAIAARLDELARPVEDDIAHASRTSTAHGSRVRRRRSICGEVPQLADALAHGATTGDRVDAVGRALAGLSADDRLLLAAHGDAIADAATHLGDRAFRVWLDQLVRRVRTDDGRSRLERQRAAARLRWWHDHDGMWHLDGRFDPVTGAEIHGRLRRITEALFAAGEGEGAPTDPLERQRWLQAQALAIAVGGSGAAAADTGRASGAGSASGAGGAGGAGVGPDITVVIDADTLLHGEHAHSRCDLDGFGLPVDTIRRWACLGSVTPVVVGTDGVRLLLGRTTRLASRAQRRALSVWYRTCALCDTGFDLCDIHHVHPWEDGGTTDLGNLLPLCGRHHHAVHEGGWRLDLTPDRTVAVTLPDGTVREHPPPRARAA